MSDDELCEDCPFRPGSPLLDDPKMAGLRADEPYHCPEGHADRSFVLASQEELGKMRVCGGFLRVIGARLQRYEN